MTLRFRLALVAAGVVAVVLAAASLVVYFTMRHELISQVDSSLTNHAALLQRRPDAALGGFGEFGDDYVELVSPAGAIAGGNTRAMTVDSRIRAVATGKSDEPYYTSTRLQGYAIRSVVAPLEPQFGGAVVVFRIVDYVNHDLDRLRLILLLVSLGGVGVAALAGALVSRTTLAPVRRLTAAAERISKTGEPRERVPETGRGELARLAGSFNTMLAALEDSLETQRRFVADASHELRTPLTSLQTNIDVLRQEGLLPPEARERLLADLHRESQEMRALISGLLELARGGDPKLDRRQVQLDELVESAVERARARFPAVEWHAELEPTVVDGYPDRLERAIWNLLENAGKWSGDGSTVEVALAGGELRVRDHGPGIAAEDQPLVFDRFYRSSAARAMPGSGLGLAIVREVAEAHGGTVVAEAAPGGGALLRLQLNGAARPNATLTKS
jgi:two-component system sensor histidine kinase MprB